MAEPTQITIHNYAGGGGGPQEEGPEGTEISRVTIVGEYSGYIWGPGVLDGVSFHEGKTYVLYEIDSDG